MYNRKEYFKELVNYAESEIELMVLEMMVKFDKQKDVASILGINQSTVSKAIARANDRFINAEAVGESFICRECDTIKNVSEKSTHTERRTLCVSCYDSFQKKRAAYKVKTVI